MKTKTVCTISIILSILLFLFHWYLWDIIDLVTPFLILVPIIIILVFVAFVLIYTIVYAAKEIKALKLRACIPLLIIVLSIMFNLLVPFTKANLDFNFKLNINARNKVVELIENGELKPEETNENMIALPSKYKRLSKGDGEVMIDCFDNHNAYIFFTYRGIIDNYSGFVYDSDEAALQELSREYFEVEKLCDSWYYCASR